MLLFAAPMLVLAWQGLWVGKSTVDITPDVPLPLGGYTERGSRLSMAGGDKLYARTVCLETPKIKIAIVSVETLTIPESLVREVKKRIPSDVLLFMAATHTHSAPDSQMLNDRMSFAIPGISSYQPKWLAWYADRLASGINEAAKDKGMTPLADVNVIEGHVDMNVGRRRLAEPDKMVTEVTGHEADQLPGPQRTFSLFTQYAAHGTVYSAKELHTRGDWLGVAAE